MDSETSPFFVACMILWLVIIVASIQVGIIARRLGWVLGIVQGWLVPGIGFVSFFLVGLFYGYSWSEEIVFYPERTYQWVVIWPTAIALTVGAALIWAKYGRQRR